MLGLDIENGPDWYGPGDFVYQRIFCIARKWVGDPEESTRSFLLDWRKSDRTLAAVLRPLWADIAAADSFLGHNFRHDMSGLIGLARRLDLPLPERRPIIDTMRCVPSGGVPRSLEYLCNQFSLGEKPHLDALDWTNALHRWRKDALAKVRVRNEMDVILTERLYRKERELGWL